MGADLRRSNRWPLIALIALTAALLGVFGIVADEALEGDTVAFANGLMAIVISKSEAEVRLGFNRTGDALDAAIDAALQEPTP